ncbi:MAG: Uncharacterized protein FD135_1845 [Comamonadaceae bacterium]|nr:MAG: Uncharacterized protein FD135_1845 [Comamonadaceae bacterium]
MPTRQVQHHLQVGHHHTIAPLHGKVHLTAHRLHIHRSYLGPFVKAIAGDRAGDLWHDGPHCRVVGTQNGGTVKRHAVQEIDKGFFESLKVVTIGFHVVGIDVGHHRHHRQQVQKRGIGLIGFHHDVITLAQAGIGPGAVQTPANHKGRIETGLGQHAGHQAGGGGFAVGTGNRNAVFQAHQLGQHQSPRYHRNAVVPGRDDFRVVSLHGGRGDHRIGPLDVLCRMANAGANTQTGQALQGGAVSLIGAGNGVVQVEQNLGNARHADTTDADKVDVFDGVFHGLRGSFTGVRFQPRGADVHGMVKQCVISPTPHKPSR